MKGEKERKKRAREREMNKRETKREKQSQSRTRKELINLARPFQASGALFRSANTRA